MFDEAKASATPSKLLGGCNFCLRKSNIWLIFVNMIWEGSVENFSLHIASFVISGECATESMDTNMFYVKSCTVFKHFRFCLTPNAILSGWWHLMINNKKWILNCKSKYKIDLVFWKFLLNCVSTLDGVLKPSQYQFSTWIPTQSQSTVQYGGKGLSFIPFHSRLLFSLPADVDWVLLSHIPFQTKFIIYSSPHFDWKFALQHQH